MEWKYEKSNCSGGKYLCNNYVIFCNGDAWRIKNPSGYLYEKYYKKLETAKRFAERKIESKRK